MVQNERVPARWDKVEFETALETRGWQLGSAAHAALRYAESGTAGSDEPFHQAVLQGYDAAMTTADMQVAYRFAVTLDRLGHTAESSPRIVASGVPLADMEFVKAQTAYDERNWRRASEKAVWAASYYSDVIEEGHSEYTDNFLAAARMMCDARSQNGGGIITGYEGFEDWLVNRCSDLRIAGAKDMIINAYSRHFGRCVTLATTAKDPEYLYGWASACHAVQVMQRYGADGLRELEHYTAVEAVETALETDDTDTIGANLRRVTDSLSVAERRQYHEALLEKELLRYLEAATAPPSDDKEYFINWDTQPYLNYWRAFYAAMELTAYQPAMRQLAHECLERVPDTIMVDDDAYEAVTWQMIAYPERWAGHETVRAEFIERLYEKAERALAQMVTSSHPEADWHCLQTAKAIHHCLCAQSGYDAETAFQRFTSMRTQALAYLKGLVDQEAAMYAIEEIEGLTL